MNTVTHLEDLPSQKLTVFNTIEALTLQAAPGSCKGGVETLLCGDIHAHPELRFVATVTTGGRVKSVPAV